MYRQSLYILTLAGCLLCVACQRTKPQSPSNRTAATADTAQLSLVFLYQRLAEEADRVLVHAVQQSGDNYTLHNLGFWYRISRKTDSPRLQTGQQIRLHTRVYTLQDTLLLDTEEQMQIGKRQTVVAADELLQEMRLGENAVLLVPWYAAYGQAGTEQVPAYENVRIEIEVKDL